MAVIRRPLSVVVVGLELALGVALLGSAAVAGVAFVHRPLTNRLDAWGFTLLPADYTSHLYHQIADLGSLPVLVIGIAVAIAASIWRDLARAAACAAGPIAAVLITEWVAKPLVGRRALLGGHSYPSGTVTAVAALAVVFLLASPPLLRPLAMVVGIGAIVIVSAAVVALRWHYPTDTLGGACVGAGSVFALDALFHLPRLWQDSLDQRRQERVRLDERPRYLEHV